MDIVLKVNTKKMTVSSKKIKFIDNTSFFVEIIKANDKHYIGGKHWTETPPDMWSADEKLLWDMMSEVEYKLKAAIIEIIK